MVSFRVRAVGAVSVIMLLTGALTSCSSGGSKGSPSGGTSSTLKIGMIADEGTAVDLSFAVSAAKAALIRINAAGGIDGHKVELDFCNEGLDPNKARACARQLISDHVIAMAGSQPLAAENDVDSALRAAHIANVGPSSYGPSDSDPNSYLLFGGQTFVNAAQAKFGVQIGGPKMGLSLLESPLTSSFVPFYKKALPTLNATLTATATSQQVTSDLSPQAADLVNSHPDWVNTNSSPAAVIGVAKDMAQLGYKGKVMVSGTELSLQQVQSAGASANQLAFVSPFPPVSAAAKFPGLQEFVHDVAAEAATGDKDAPTSKDYVQFLALDAYFSVIAIGKIANAAKALDANSFKTAIDAAKNVDLGGVIPPWTPNKSISKAVPRASDGSFYFSEWSNGHAALVSNTPTDVTSLVQAGTS